MSKKKIPLAARKTPSQERSRETLEAILEAGRQVFSTVDYRHGTVGRIAQRAGVSVGTLYQYFPSKDALIVALTERHMRTTADRIMGLAAQAEGLSLTEVIRLFVRTVWDIFKRDANLIRVTFEEAPSPKLANDKKAAILWEVADAVERLLSPYPEITVRNKRLMAHMVVSLVDVQVRHLVLHPPPGSSEAEVFEHLIAQITGYLTGGHATIA